MSQQKYKIDPLVARYNRRNTDSLQQDQQPAPQPQRPTRRQNIEKQVEYYGNAIEPFNMNNDQEQLGTIDQDGYFVFNSISNKRGKGRDAWLDSIGQADDQAIVDKIVKKIKDQGGRFKSLYQHTKCKQGQEDGDSQKQGEEGGIEQAAQSQQQSENSKGLSAQQLIQIMISLLPSNKNANSLMKALKKQKNLEQYNKLLTISNEYIQKTGEYDILTKKKEELQQMLDEIVQNKKQKLRLKSQAEQKANIQAIIQKQKEQQIIDNWDQSSVNQGDGKQVSVGGDKKEVQENQSDSDAEDDEDEEQQHHQMF